MGKRRLEVSLVPIAQSVGIARVFVRHQLISLRYADLIEDACQITSELVANAVDATVAAGAGAGDRIRLCLGPHHGRPLLEVWDPSPRMPVVREPDFVSESGRGLHIVAALAAGFGWYETRERGGKVVWARLG